MRVIHLQSQNEICSRMKYAKTFLERTKGLMFISEMKGFDALLIEKCNSVHNCFVRFPIDLIFLNNDFKVIRVVRGFKPWHFTRIHLKATKVLELKNGAAAQVKAGDYLEVRDV